MRALLLYLSQQRRLRRWAETSGAARRLSSRFVAGRALEDALAVITRVNGEKISVTLDRLGENVTSLDEAGMSRNEYMRALHAIHRAGMDANVSIKLTQFGIDLDEAACRANVAQLVETATALGSFVRVDMESSAYAERTLRLVVDLHAGGGSVGAVIQAYLRRSRQDVEMLCEKRIRVRLCKGAYLEPPEVAFQSKADVDCNYVKLMKVLLERGNYPAIATHDEAIIQETRRFARAGNIPRDRFEFQMLYGIRRDMQRKLVQQGYRLRLYVPYGEAWYPYFMRRLAERPANVLFLVRNLLR